MTGISNDPSFVKLHTKVTTLLAVLVVGVPLLLATLGYGVLELINISRNVGIVCVLQEDVHRVEDRLNNHIEIDNKRYKTNYLNNKISIVEDQPCHVGITD